MSESVKWGPRRVLRPLSPNWQLATELPPVHAPVVGSMTETKAGGLLGTWLGDAGVGGLEVDGDARDAAGKLGSVSLEDALAGGGVGLAQHAERKAAVQEGGLRDRPVAEDLAEQAVLRVERELQHAVGGEVVAYVVVAVAVLAAELAGQRMPWVEKGSRPPLETSSRQWLRV
jgi:hypothetical protein